MSASKPLPRTSMGLAEQDRTIDNLIAENKRLASHRIKLIRERAEPTNGENDG